MAQRDRTSIGVKPETKSVVEDAESVLEDELGIDITQEQAVKIACERVVEGSA